MIALAAIAGALAAGGILVIARELRPAPPRLDAALARLQATGPTEANRPTQWRERLGAHLATHLARRTGPWAIPRTDLALLDRSVESFMLAKLTWLLAGTLAPALSAGTLPLLGVSLPWALPVLATLAGAVGLSFVPDLQVRATARRRRADFRHALACYLQLVVLERQAGAALNAALEGPTTVVDAWPFARIGTALETARRAQQPPWRALADLGDRIGIPDLVDLAHSAQIAGIEGAQMHQVLTAKITAMRHEAAAATRAEANARTTTMWVPTSLLMLGFVILIAYPFFTRLIGSG